MFLRSRATAMTIPDTPPRNPFMAIGPGPVYAGDAVAENGPARNEEALN